MEKETKEKIDELQLSSDAKKCLMDMDMILHLTQSEQDKRCEMAVGLLVTAARGAGLTTYVRQYANIVEEASAYLRRTDEISLIELDFPKNNESDEKMFYASPGRVVTNRNHFLGTMMISLCEFEGKELIKSESFERLIQFLDSNKEYIHFVIHILPEFKEKQELLTRLRKLMHVMEVTLTIPDVNDSYAYIMKELVRRKYLITDEVADNLKQEILPVLCASKAFCGYTTLENLIHRIAYELVFDQDRNTVTEAKLRKIVEEMSMEIVEEGIGIGFIR